MRHKSFNEIMPSDLFDNNFAFILLLEIGETDFPTHFLSSGKTVSRK